MEFALGTIIDPFAAGHTCGAVKMDGKVYRLPDLAALTHSDLPRSLELFFADWAQNLSRVEKAISALKAGADITALDENAVEVVQPLRPTKVYCVGANYAEHLLEMGDPPERKPGRPPFFYMKPATTALCGPGDSVRIPPDCRNFDWEVEVVVVFGAGGSNVSVDQASSLIAGYMLGIDFTSRDQMVDRELIFQFNFALGKCQDNTAPIGPWIVPAMFLDGANLNFSLSRNGERKQTANTSQMLYSMAEQVSEISKRIRIEPGDILFTGSPAGVGAPRGERVESGDRFIATADAIGDLKVTVR